MNPDAGQETTRQQIVGSGAFREMAERGLATRKPGAGWRPCRTSTASGSGNSPPSSRGGTRRSGGETVPRVFVRFYRAEAARTRVGGGTGLGLAIARVLARAQGGDLVAENGAAGGAVVSLRLPRE